MSKKTAAYMRWHKDKRVDDEVLRHPADGEAWKDFDGQHPMFSADPWKCMKDLFFMMSMLIPGRSAPGRDIDVSLQPLVEELTNLWEHGVQTYDSTKGYLAYPNRIMDASSHSLRCKIGYMGARWYLPENHNWQRSKLFNGEIENRSKPVELSGEQILDKINLGTYRPYRKHPNNRKRQRNENPTPNLTKRSILFNLPYWKTLKLRHNLDVVHIEKNIYDNLVGTLLSIDGKNKDTDKARLDLEDMRIRKELHLTWHANSSLEKPPALYTLSPTERQIERQGFADFLKSIKYPDGYAANISNCVTANGGKLVGLKSHNGHVLLQRLLPIGMRGYLPTEIGTTLLMFTSRMLGLLKGFVGNKARPEGSIAEGYISKEFHCICMELKRCLTGKKGTMMGVTMTRGWRFSLKMFVLLMNQLRNQKSPEATDEMLSLANGPNALVNTYSGCISNGVRFHSIDRDNHRKCQNSGLVVEGDYQGQLIKFYG
ncbi:uncharacterized protein LOC114317608 [Camellia sinensis]|uniref:uncharacterized protein LOC114317608 n=1 Tax=Camellia sinensis TaxID=4442 RepID=UPI0010365D4C|nr:uncharacterized protein LOC114317608 [Camellia sinensis]